MKVLNFFYNTHTHDQVHDFEMPSRWQEPEMERPGFSRVVLRTE